jgi:hypothetical protein
MSRKTGDDCTFRQRDVREAIKAARNAGLENFRVDIDKCGTISIVPMAPGEGAQKQGTQWDKLLEDDA